MSNLPICTVCHRVKKPAGRDSWDNGYCDYDCEGYTQGEHPGSHWPFEACEPLDGKTVCFICRKPIEALNE